MICLCFVRHCSAAGNFKSQFCINFDDRLFPHSRKVRLLIKKEVSCLRLWRRSLRPSPGCRFRTGLQNTKEMLFADRKVVSGKSLNLVEWHYQGNVDFGKIDLSSAVKSFQYNLTLSHKNLTGRFPLLDEPRVPEG